MAISIIVPTYNVAKYVEDSLWSALDNMTMDDELIIVDDESTDNTLDIVRKLKTYTDKQIKIIPIPNGGPANARNVGLSVASQEWVYFMDPDDYLRHGSFDTVRPYMNAKDDKTYDVIEWDYRHTNPELYKSNLDESIELENAVEQSAIDTFKQRYLEKINVMPWIFFYKRSELNIKFDTSLRKSDDADFWLREMTYLYQHNKVILRLKYKDNINPYLYNINGDSITGKKEISRIKYDKFLHDELQLIRVLESDQNPLVNQMDNHIKELIVRDNNIVRDLYKNKFKVVD